MLEPLAGKHRAAVGLLLLFLQWPFWWPSTRRRTHRLGKIPLPGALWPLILLLFAGCLLHPATGYTPDRRLHRPPAVQGILNGYQTMDTLAGLNFRAVIALNIQALGDRTPEVERGHHPAGFLAAGLLAGGLRHAHPHRRHCRGPRSPRCATGAETLTLLANALFGRVGQVLLAAIFIIACFNTCVGLISGVSSISTSSGKFPTPDGPLSLP